MRSIFLILSWMLLIGTVSYAQENTALLCSDGIDNDGDGFADCDDLDCINISPIGCSRCSNDGTSFGDEILCADITCAGAANPNVYTDPNQALGLPDSDDDLNQGTAVSLGQGGSICIGFTDNLLANSGTPADDVFIFEVGLLSEASLISLRPFDQATIDQLNAFGVMDADGDGYYEFGTIAGATDGVDIDAFFPPGTPGGTLLFDAVRIEDVSGDECDEPSPGPDIDAVCALFSLPPDCAGIPGGPNVLDDCGVCLPPDDTNFNQSCLDCAGTPNGFFEIDQCGDCLNPFDQLWNQACADCAGIPNGTSGIDNCSIVGGDATCGQDNGTAVVTVVGGTIPYEFEWSNGFNGQNISFLAPSDYTVTVTDDVGCETTCSVTIGTTVNPTCTVNTNPTSCGMDNGSAEVIPDGGTGPFTFLWSNGATVQAINDLSANDYSVTITDANGCTTECMGTVGASGDISCSIDGTNTTCGNANGQAILQVTGGLAPFTYIWNTGETTADLTNIADGDYSVTVTDDAGCLTECSVTIDVSTAITCTALGTATTDGLDNGSAIATPDGGNAPYQYNWSSGDNADTADNLAAGDYTVTVTDADGCMTECSVTIDDSSGIACTILGTNTSCGSDNGAALIDVTGGDDPLQYEWNTGSTNNELNNLEPGDYTVTVTDGSGFMTECSVTIEPSISLSCTAVKTNTSCGLDNGSAAITVDGGVAPFQYDWSNGASGEVVEDLEPGDYSITVTDANGCNTECSLTVQASSNPSCTVVGSDTTLGENNGSAAADVDGGSEPYTYEWSNGATSESISDLEAGDYEVTVEDADGCITECSVTIQASSVPTCSIIGEDTSCGLDNGSANISIGGGETPYQIEWNNGSDQEELSDLEPGEYTATVTDNAGAITECSITIASSTNPTCEANSTDTTEGESNGSVSVNVDGGVEPYSYEWNNGEFSQTIDNLGAGDYTATVTDAEGCTTECSATVAASSVPSCSIDGEDTSCGNADGAATVSIGGGEAPYDIVWSNGETTQAITDLEAGDYSVTITDSAGTITECDITIDSSTNPTCEATSTDTTEGESNGSVVVNAEGGVEPYSYEWSNGSNSQTIDNLGAGDYSVTVSDADGCTTECSATVAASSVPSCSIDGEDTSCGNADGAATVSIGGGEAPYDIVWSNGETTQAITDLEAGDYSATITDNAGATTECNITIEESDAISCMVSGLDASEGQDNGQASVDVTGAEGDLIYEWSNGETTASIENLGEGDYSVSITDENGCITDCSITINSSSNPSCIIEGNNTFCDQSNGSAAITIQGGEAPYTIEWSNGETAETIEDLDADEYTATVTDNAGASTTCSITIESSSSPECMVQTTNTAPGEENGSAIVNVSNGLEPYLYEWNNGAQTQEIFDLAAGDYSVTVTDSDGCVTECSATVESSNEPSCLIAFEQATCGLDNGSATVTASGGTAPYAFAWNNGETSAEITDLSEGQYDVTVTDDQGSTTECSILITSSEGISCTISSTDVDCIVEFGEATVTVTGGVEPYAFVWSNGETLQTIEDLEPGTYSVIVTDDVGCTTECMTDIIIDPSANTECMDCAGNMNGTAIVDDCGSCLEPDDPTYNQSCTDCEGTLNGSAVVDNCGVCMEPDDPAFNRACEEVSIYIPNVITPDAFDFNRDFRLSAPEDQVVEIAEYNIYDRWGTIVYQASNFEIESTEYWWDGSINGKKSPPAVYAYAIQVEFINGNIETFVGNVTVIR